MCKDQSKIRTHKIDSRYNEKTTNNDIALLKLKKKIDFKKYSGTVTPVCLPDLPRKYYGETVKHQNLAKQKKLARTHILKFQ